MPESKDGAPAPRTNPTAAAIPSGDSPKRHGDPIAATGSSSEAMPSEAASPGHSPKPHGDPLRHALAGTKAPR